MGFFFMAMGWGKMLMTKRIQNRQLIVLFRLKRIRILFRYLYRGQWFPDSGVLSVLSGIRRGVLLFCLVRMDVSGSNQRRVLLLTVL